MASSCAAAGTSAVTAAVANASFTLFLGALDISTSPQGCFLSPLSIVYALSLALNGAGKDSPTQSELLRVLSGSFASNQQPLSETDLNSELGRAMTLLNGQCAAPDADNPTSQLVLANSIWTHRGLALKPAYVEAMQSLYQATARTATNGAKDVNSWVAEVTQGLIKDLVQSDNFDAILANAIYFKGLWTHAFQPRLTRDGDFTTPGGPKQASFMQQTYEGRDRIQGARKEGVYDAVALPYKGDTFSAIALLPAPGVGVAAAVKEWAAGPQDLQPLGRVRVVLPKFKVSSTLSLTPVLRSLGVTTAFSGGAADFSRMAEGGLFISDVVHKAVVEVDEEGTVAAAATAIMMTRAMPLPPPELVFNRPFAFIIHHIPTGLPAFVGVVNDPSA